MTTTSDGSHADMDPEDAKLVTLARAARLRGHAPYTNVAEGAAVRDADGRTYAAATVENRDPGLTVSALRGAVVAMASSGARALEAAALATDALAVAPGDVATLREFGAGVLVYIVGRDGTVVDVAIV